MIETEKGWEPERMCAACRKRAAKQTLLRIVQRDGAIHIDREQQSQRRAVYLCRSVECIRKAQKSRALGRAFRRQVDDSVYAELERSVDNRQ